MWTGCYEFFCGYLEMLLLMRGRFKCCCDSSLQAATAAPHALLVKVWSSPLKLTPSSACRVKFDWVLTNFVFGIWITPNKGLNSPFENIQWLLFLPFCVWSTIWQSVFFVTVLYCFRLPFVLIKRDKNIILYIFCKLF